MGCDIHVYIERQSDDGIWEPVYAKLRKCGECKGTTHVNPRCANCTAKEIDHDDLTGRCLAGPLSFELKEDVCPSCENHWAPPGLEEEWSDTFYHGRNYGLFGVLAGVRDAAVPDFTEENRGIPDDCSEEYARVSDCSDWHSHTYYTLAELRRYPFKRKYPDFYRAMERMSSVESDPTRIRMLMFFDN